MRRFDDLTVVEQDDIRKKFVLPNDTSYTEVDELNRPFYMISGSLVACTVKNNNFHVHGNKNNGRV